MKKKKIKKETEEVVEVFDVENKEGKIEKEIVKKGEIEKVHASKKELKKQEKQLKIVLGVLGILILFFASILVANYLNNHVNYDSVVKFKRVAYCDTKPCLITYNTYIPLYDDNGKHYADYNFYIRTNPKELEKIPFEGQLDLNKGYTMNITEEFSCGGYETIAFANLAKQYSVIGSVFINDESAGCDSLSRYVYFEFKEGDETKIVQRGETSCYDVYVANCEILQATEKIMAETFVEINA